MPGLLKPQFYITRPNGDFVPLIPVDEIPAHVSVGGVSRALSTQDIDGMYCVGGPVDTRPGQYFAIEGPSPPVFGKAHTGFPSNQTFKPTVPVHFGNYPAGVYDNLSSHIEPSVATTYNYFGSPNIETNPKKMTPVLSRPSAFGIPSTNPLSKSVNCHSYSHNFDTPPSSPVTMALKTTNSQPQSPTYPKESHPGARSTIPYPSIRVNPCGAPGPLGAPIPLTGKKEYCSYWLRHGECDYQQQGCLYKHEMPTDMATLSRLGLREIPRWFREAHNLSANSFNNLNSNSSGLARSRWAPGNGGFSSGGGGGLGKESWRGSSDRAMGGSSRGPGPGPSPLSVSSPKRQFMLPMPPPSPPESPPNTNLNTPTSASSNRKETQPTNSRLAVRTTPQRARTLATAKAAAATSGKATIKVEKADKHARGRIVSVEPDPLPNYPSLAPLKRVDCGTDGAGDII